MIQRQQKYIFSEWINYLKFLTAALFVVKDTNHRTQWTMPLHELHFQRWKTLLKLEDSKGWNIVTTKYRMFVLAFCATIDSVIYLMEKLIFRRNATHCISPYAIVKCVCVCVRVCVCVCVCMCVCRAWGPQENGLRYRRRFLLKLLGITPDITYKSFTQIELQIRRWRTKWRPWNTIIGRNSAIY